MQVLLILLGIAIGFVMGWLLLKGKTSALDERSAQQLQQLAVSTQSLEEERKKVIALNTANATLEADYKNLSEKLITQKGELEELQSRFNKEFENLANKILEEKSVKFTEQNRANIDSILTPLKEKIKEFEEKVDKAYKSESAERNTLRGEIKSLVELNKQISEEANNLARALKGDSKKQGNWGEVILEKILERSGLMKDREYKTQVSMENDEGRRLQPDVIILLPDNKHIIVDAKVSLVAYEAFVNAATDEEREQYIKEHIASVRNHIRMLSEKNYQMTAGLDTPDFVLLFMPIESSFSIAVQADNELFAYAWDRKIVIVSPTTLLATLRTISSIWKQERQTRNALEIADLGGKLYDKFVSFTEDMTMVGKKMDEAKGNYIEAMKKLYEGRGNLVRSAEKLKELGAKTSKQLPVILLERAEENS